MVTGEHGLHGLNVQLNVAVDRNQEHENVTTLHQVMEEVNVQEIHLVNKTVIHNLAQVFELPRLLNLPHYFFLFIPVNPIQFLKFITNYDNFLTSASFFKMTIFFLRQKTHSNLWLQLTLIRGVF